MGQTNKKMKTAIYIHPKSKEKIYQMIYVERKLGNKANIQTVLHMAIELLYGLYTKKFGDIRKFK